MNYFKVGGTLYLHIVHDFVYARTEVANAYVPAYLVPNSPQFLDSRFPLSVAFSFLVAVVSPTVEATRRRPPAPT